MGRQIGPSKTNVRKKEKGTISVWAISQGKITSLKCYAKSYQQRKKVTLRKRLQKEKGLPRHADCPLIKGKKETRRSLIDPKIGRKIHDILEITWLKIRSSQSGQIIKIIRQEPNLWKTQTIRRKKKKGCRGAWQLKNLAL